MDKYEYQVCADQIKSCISERKYSEAMKIADTIDWRKVKSFSMLCTVSEIYKINKHYQDSRDILLLAYERYPGRANVVYALCELAVKMNDISDAVEYYKEYVHLKPNDTNKYILLYKIYEAQDVPVEERIELLEEFTNLDYQERWAYELATLYHKIGQESKCIEVCDRLVLWFGEGPYVKKALELKMQHATLTPEQQRKYDGTETPSAYSAVPVQPELKYQNADPVYNRQAVYGNQAPMTSNSMNAARPTGPIGQFGTGPIMGQFPTGQITGQFPTGQIAGQYQTGQMQGVMPGMNPYGQPAYEQRDYSQPIYQTGDIYAQPDYMQGANYGAYTNIQVQPVNAGKYNTIDLENALRENVQEVMSSSAPEIVAPYYAHTAQLYEQSPMQYAQQMEQVGIEQEAYEQGAYEGVQQDENIPVSAPVRKEAPKVATGIIDIPNIKPVKSSSDDVPTTKETMSSEDSGIATRNESVEEDAASQEDISSKADISSQSNATSTAQDGESMTSYGSKDADKAAGNGNAEKVDVNAPQDDFVATVHARPVKKPVPVAPITAGERFDKVLSQEYDGQIQLSLPETGVVEKQITGQIDISDFMAELERRKKERDQQRLEQIRRRSMEQTTDIMSQLVGVIPSLEKLQERDEAIAKSRGRDVLHDPVVMTAPPVAVASRPKTLEEEYGGSFEAAKRAEADFVRRVTGELPKPEDLDDSEEDTILEEDISEEDISKEDITEENIAEENTEDSAVNEEAEVEESEIEEGEIEETEIEETEIEEETEDEEAEAEEPETEEVEAEELEIEEVEEDESEIEEVEVEEPETEEVEAEELEAEEAEVEETEEAEDELPEVEELPEIEEVTFEEEESSEETGEVEEETEADEETEEESDGVSDDTAVMDIENIVDRYLREEDGEEDDEEEAEVSEEAEGGIEDSEEAETEEESDIEEESDSEEAVETEESDSKSNRPKYMTMDETPKPKRDFTDDEYEVFLVYDGIENLKAQIVDAMDLATLSPKSGNIVVMGQQEFGRKPLAIDMVKAIQARDEEFIGKVAKISGEALNKKDISLTLKKLKNGALIVENAGGLTQKTVQTIIDSLLTAEDDILVVFEDEKDAIKPLLDRCKDSKKVFNSRIEMAPFTNDDLVSYAKGYAMEQEYSIDEMGILALYTRIGSLQQSIDYTVSVEDVKDIIDEAIRHVDRKNMGHFMDVLLAKRYDKNDFIILREKDFI